MSAIQRLDSFATHGDPEQRFPAHGRVDYGWTSRLLVARAVGPFNLELVRRLADLGIGAHGRMVDGTPWGHLSVFRSSAVCTPDALQALRTVLDVLNARGLQANATAFVLPPEVEGAAMMRKTYAKAFHDAGLMFQPFDAAPPALAWLRECIGEGIPTTLPDLDGVFDQP